MKKGILAKKIGMTQIFDDFGNLVPVTVLEAGPCVVTQKKTFEKEGYDAVQIGFLDIKVKHLTKPLKGHFDKFSIMPKKVLKELKLEDTAKYEVGNSICVDTFEAGEIVDVTGISKGKGTQGAIKRHNFSKGPETHGSKYHRGVGSLSSATTPGRVKKGKKMSGRMGNERVTIQNLQVVSVDLSKNIMLIKGSVPGPKGCVLLIKNAVKINS